MAHKDQSMEEERGSLFVQGSQKNSAYASSHARLQCHLETKMQDATSWILKANP